MLVIVIEFLKVHGHYAGPLLDLIPLQEPRRRGLTTKYTKPERIPQAGSRRRESADPYVPSYDGVRALIPPAGGTATCQVHGHLAHSTR